MKITYPDNTTEAFTYDREGNNLSATDRMGRTVTMKYDKVGNLVSKTYPNGAGVSYVYDANYNLVSETSASGGVTYYEYDKIGRNTAIIDALGNRTTFFYNAKSQLESMTDPMAEHTHTAMMTTATALRPHIPTAQVCPLFTMQEDVSPVRPTSTATTHIMFMTVQTGLSV